MKVVLISCVSKKLLHKAKAEELYISPWFKFARRYADSLKPDKKFILSAKYGLLSPDEEIESYNETLNTMSKEDIEKWASKVIIQLKQKTDLTKDEFIFLAGERYRKYLVLEIKTYKIPMQGLGIGRQLKFMKGSVK